MTQVPRSLLFGLIFPTPSLSPKKVLSISTSQIQRLELARRTGFVARVDAVLCEGFGERWSQIDRTARAKRLGSGCDVGLQLGIGNELHLAQFMLLYAVRGDTLLQDPSAAPILGNSRLDWRQKLFQLTFLARVNLDDGSERDLK